MIPPLGPSVSLEVIVLASIYTKGDLAYGICTLHIELTLPSEGPKTVNESRPTSAPKIMLF